jgi:hypothetical protein
MAEETADMATPDLTMKLKERASLANWPAEAVHSLSVVDNAGNLEVYVDPNNQDLVNGLEYGTESIPPNPVIRKFSYEMSDHLQDHLHKSLKKYVNQLLEEL